MIRIRRTILLFSVIIASTFVLYGCNKNNKEEETTTSNEITTETTIETTSEEVKEMTTNTTEEIITEQTIESSSEEETTEVKNNKIKLHSLNKDSYETEEKNADIEIDIALTPQFLVDKVINDIAESGIIVKIDYVKTEDRTIIVSFKNDTANVGSGVEISILDSIAKTLLDNLPIYDSVVYRNEDEAYESGHIELGIDEPYLSR